jgi:predicted TIM-barrel enzyme
MGMLFTRQQVLDRLHQTIAQGELILGAGCSNGLVSKCAEIAGADLIIVYSTGISRMMGLPTSRIGDSNAITLQMCDEIWNVVEHTPLVAGVEGTDPTRRDLMRLLTAFRERGYSGVINFPNITGLGEYYRRRREKVGYGFAREVEMMRAARKLDLFTMAYVYSADDAREMVDAGVDCVAAHVGPTEGGLAGVQYDNTLESALQLVTHIVQAAKAANPDVICLAHGGPFAEPEDTAVLYDIPGVVGFVGASSIERIPIEKAVTDVVRRFKRAKSCHLPGKARAR